MTKEEPDVKYDTKFQTSIACRPKWVRDRILEYAKTSEVVSARKPRGLLINHAREQFQCWSENPDLGSGIKYGKNARKWTCDACGSWQHATFDVCKWCGAYEDERPMWG